MITHVRSVLLLGLVLSCVSCSNARKKDVVCAPEKKGVEQKEKVQKKQGEKKQITATSTVYHVASEAEFNELFSQKKPVLIKFFSNSCPPCRYMKSIFTETAKTFGDRVVFVEVDTQMRDLQPLAQRYSVRGIPCFVMVNTQKKEVDRVVGRMESLEFSSFVEKALNKAN